MRLDLPSSSIMPDCVFLSVSLSVYFCSQFWQLVKMCLGSQWVSKGHCSMLNKVVWLSKMKNGGFESSPVFFLWLKLSSNFWSFVWWTQLGSLVQASIKQKDWMWTQCHCCGTIMWNQEARECYCTCLIPLPSNSVIYSIVFMVWGTSVSTSLKLWSIAEHYKQGVPLL